jgi:hypothetical protein
MRLTKPMASFNRPDNENEVNLQYFGKSSSTIHPSFLNYYFMTLAGLGGIIN